MIGKEQFSKLFKVGEIIESGAGSNRKNAARLKILTIEEHMVRFQSIHCVGKSHMKYGYLSMLVDGFEDIDPQSIQKSVKRILNRAGFTPDYSIKNHAYSFAKAIHERTNEDLFLPEGEYRVTDLSLHTGRNYIEGGRVAVLVDRIERDPKARKQCIRHYGAWCQVCKFDFEKIYGAIGKGYIHVHHKRLLSSSNGTRKVDPIKDLIPLCPNCHAMAHSRSKPLTVDELRKKMMWRGSTEERKIQA